MQSHIQRVVRDDAGIFVMSTGRSNVAYRTSDDSVSWEYKPGSEDRVRDFAASRDHLVVATYEGRIDVLERTGGTVVGSVDAAEPAGSVAVTNGGTVVATQPASGALVVTNTQGHRLATIDIGGVPLSVVADDRHAVVVAALTHVVHIVDLTTYAVRLVDVGSRARELVLAGDAAVMTTPTTREVVKIDLASGTSTIVATVEDLSPSISNFGRSMTANEERVVVRIYNPVGVYGFAVMDTPSSEVQEVWNLDIGATTEYTIINDAVYAGSSTVHGWYGWQLQG